MEDIKRVQELHSLLRKAKYYYYEKSESIITDYEYDMFEKEYNLLCDKLQISKEYRVTEKVGWAYNIPRNIINFVNQESTCEFCKYWSEVAFPKNFGSCSISKTNNGMMFSGCGLKTNRNFNCELFSAEKE